MRKENRAIWQVNKAGLKGDKMGQKKVQRTIEWHKEQADKAAREAIESLKEMKKLEKDEVKENNA